MLKIVQWNINGPGTKHGPWSRRKELIAETLCTVSPDILVMQAVRKTADGENQAAELAEMLTGYPHAVFETAMEHDDGTADGLAFLSRRPVRHVSRRPLGRRPGTEDPFDRVLLHGQFELPGGPLHVLNAHFSWVEEQARDNVSEVLPYAGSISAPAVLLGDLNRPPDAESMRIFERLGWTDAWASLRPDQPGHTFESDAPTMRIDYAWLNPALRPHAAAIEIIGQARGPVRPSDHLGLLLTLNLEP